jgi:hypothetical protein
MKIKIQNGNIESILHFSIDQEYEDMKQAISNCLQKDHEYKMITYNDKSDTIIFSATYLQNSLIRYPKIN